MGAALDKEEQKDEVDSPLAADNGTTGADNPTTPQPKSVRDLVLAFEDREVRKASSTSDLRPNVIESRPRVPVSGTRSGFGSFEKIHTDFSPRSNETRGPKPAVSFLLPTSPVSPGQKTELRPDSVARTSSVDSDKSDEPRSPFARWARAFSAFRESTGSPKSPEVRKSSNSESTTGPSSPSLLSSITSVDARNESESETEIADEHEGVVENGLAVSKLKGGSESDDGVLDSFMNRLKVWMKRDERGNFGNESESERRPRAYTSPPEMDSNIQKV